MSLTSQAQPGKAWQVLKELLALGMAESLRRPGLLAHLSPDSDTHRLTLGELLALPGLGRSICELGVGSGASLPTSGLCHPDGWSPACAVNLPHWVTPFPTVMGHEGGWRLCILAIAVLQGSVGTAQGAEGLSCTGQGHASSS